MIENIEEQANTSLENKAPSELLDLLRANLEKSDEVLKISRDIKKYMRLQNIWGTLRLLLIIGPIILGFIYLPPLIQEYLSSYKSLLQ
ncbi:MAG: hypothetical protein WC467_00290 [Patescibacteria group bacterium]